MCPTVPNYLSESFAVLAGNKSKCKTIPNHGNLSLEFTKFTVICRLISTPNCDMFNNDDIVIASRPAHYFGIKGEQSFIIIGGVVKA